MNDLHLPRRTGQREENGLFLANLERRVMFMKTIAMAAVAVSMLTVPSFAASHNGGSHDGHAGLGIDVSHAGKTREEHRKFHDALKQEDKSYVSAVCAIEYSHRTPEEKAYCADIADY
jgi:hypothetical protein